MSGAERTPGSMLEVYMHALASRTEDEFLDSVNLGIGNYTEGEYWQQVKAFRSGVFADTGLTRKLMERAKYETKRAIVEKIFEDEGSQLLKNINGYPDPSEYDSKRAYFEENADEIWQNLGNEDEDYSWAEHQAWLVHQVTGIPTDWTPPQWRMLKMRHEASRSKDAHLIDNLFGRPPEPDGISAMEEFEP